MAKERRRVRYHIEVKEYWDDVIGDAIEWKQVADTGNEKNNGPVYEYVPKPGCVEVKERSRTLLEQTLPEIDLKAIIKAVNGL